MQDEQQDNGIYLRTTTTGLINDTAHGEHHYEIEGDEFLYPQAHPKLCGCVGHDTHR